MDRDLCDRVVPAQHAGRRTRPRHAEHRGRAGPLDRQSGLAASRNPSAFPLRLGRARCEVPARSPSPGSPEEQSLKRAILYAADPFWNIPGKPVEDPRATAWVQADRAPQGLRLDGDPPSTSEGVTVVAMTPHSSSWSASGPRRPGRSAAQDYPGWTRHGRRPAVSDRHDQPGDAARSSRRARIGWSTATNPDRSGSVWESRSPVCWRSRSRSHQHASDGRPPADGNHRDLRPHR